MEKEKKEEAYLLNKKWLDSFNLFLWECVIFISHGF